MTDYFDILDVAAFLLFAFILYFLSVISKRLGNVMGLKKYYYLYYLAIFFSLFASIITILSIRMQYTDFYGYVFFSIGLTLGLIASIRYWGWLIIELFRG
ncbi:Uncharacterised protein [uncultured archaeon]|nr:Uncharacterised protein [uncultured archaeon]